MAKGGQWERDVCKYLSFWLQGTEKPFQFWRGHGSGGNFTKNNLVGERFAGDIYHITEDAKRITDKLVFECKSGYPKTTLDNHLKYNKKDNILEFWEQVVHDAEKVNKYPMLIYKKKGMPTPWLGICPELYNKLKKYLENIRFLHLKWDNELPDTYFFSYKEFFELVTPDIIKRLKGKK